MGFSVNTQVPRAHKRSCVYLEVVKELLLRSHGGVGVGGGREIKLLRTVIPTVAILLMTTSLSAAKVVHPTHEFTVEYFKHCLGNFKSFWHFKPFIRIFWSDSPWSGAARV